MQAYALTLHGKAGNEVLGCMVGMDVRLSLQEFMIFEENGCFYLKLLEIKGDTFAYITDF